MISKIQFGKFLLEYVEDKKCVIDVGCGDCQVLYFIHKHNSNIIGIDVEFKKSKELQFCKEFIKKIDVESREKQEGLIHWPIKSSSVDFLYSRTVLEHVPNIGTFLDEIKRVTIPGTVSLHYFPSYYQLIECHTGVPLGSCIKNKYWYQIMCTIWFCKKKYRGLKGAENAVRYIQNFTFYRRPKEIKNECTKRNLVLVDITHLFLEKIGSNVGLKLSKIKILTFLFRKVRSNCILIINK